MCSVSLRSLIVVLLVMTPIMMTPEVPSGRVREWIDCQEDEPCWECDRMGNLICGPGYQPQENQP